MQEESPALSRGAGNLVFIPPGMPLHHAVRNGYEGEFLWVCFPPLPSWMHWLQLPVGGSQPLFVSIDEYGDRERIEYAFRRLIREHDGSGPFREALTMNALEEVMLLSSRQLRQSRAHSLRDRRIDEVLRLLVLHYKKPVSVEWLAKKVFLSSSRLSHLFKEQTGETIKEALLKIRIQQAAQHLTFTTRKVAEVAGDVGFQCPFYFARKFKSFMGETPTTYRNQATRL